MAFENYMSLPAAARFCGLTAVIIWKHCKSGAIKSSELAGRRFVLDTDLRDWVASGGVKPKGRPRKVKTEANQ
jgi:hypothetical protein